MSILTARIEVVTPASAPAGQAARWLREPPRRERRALMTLDLPTLG